MKFRTLTFMILVTSFALSLGAYSPVRADNDVVRTRLVILSEKQDAYDSAKNAYAKSPRSISARRNLIVSYLEVVDARLTRIDEELRKVNAESEGTKLFLANIAEDHVAIQNLIDLSLTARSTTDLSEVIARVSQLHAFTDNAASRAHVLATHRDVLQTRGIDIIENRLERIEKAIAILLNDGKDVSRLTVLATQIRSNIDEAKVRISTITLEDLNNDEQFALRKTELLSVETIIRGAFEDLNTLSENGREIRDSK